MTEEQLTNLLRGAHEMNWPDAPERHPERTEHCPPTRRFENAVHKGWDEQYRDHVRGCRYCRKLSAMQWNIEPPGLGAVAKHLADGTAPDEAALERFLDEHHRVHYRNLFKSARIRFLVGLIQAGRETESWLRSDGYGAASAGLVLAAGASVRPASRFQIRLASEDGSLVTIVRQTAADELEVLVESPGIENAGRKVEVEVVRERAESMRVEIPMTKLGDRVFARTTLGTFHDLAPTLEKCTVISSWLS